MGYNSKQEIVSLDIEVFSSKSDIEKYYGEHEMKPTFPCVFVRKSDVDKVGSDGEPLYLQFANLFYICVPSKHVPEGKAMMNSMLFNFSGSSTRYRYMLTNHVDMPKGPNGSTIRMKVTMPSSANYNSWTIAYETLRHAIEFGDMSFYVGQGHVLHGLISGLTFHFTVIDVVDPEKKKIVDGYVLLTNETVIDFVSTVPGMTIAPRKQ